jgi:hypothetical protein
MVIINSNNSKTWYKDMKSKEYINELHGIIGVWLEGVRLEGVLFFHHLVVENGNINGKKGLR